MVDERFAGTAFLPNDDARALGCLGYVARASGMRTDARLEHAATALPVTETGAAAGDVLARYTVRRDEFAVATKLACLLIENHGRPNGRMAPTSLWRKKVSTSPTPETACDQDL